jgi:hypothetical protein
MGILLSLIQKNSFYVLVGVLLNERISTTEAPCDTVKRVSN